MSEYPQRVGRMTECSDHSAVKTGALLVIKHIKGMKYELSNNLVTFNTSVNKAI